MDDAFRVGEYIKAGGSSGTVDAITLRNVMLQIIPFSELGSITNYMRGALLVKFNIQLPYDTDIEKGRKIIKKVGKKMLKDPELGPALCPSQGDRGIVCRRVGRSILRAPSYHSADGRHSSSIS